MAKSFFYDVGQINALLKQLSDRTTVLEALGGLSSNSPDDAKVASFVGNTASQTRKRMDIVYRTAISVTDYGVVGNGTTDDTSAFRAAVTAAVTAGVPLVIPGTMNIGISASIILPNGFRMYTNGAKFTGLAALGRSPVIRVQSFSNIEGGITVVTSGGTACQGVTVSDAWHTYVDRISVESTVVAAGSANIRDNGTTITRCNFVTIDRINVKNYDWAVWLEDNNKVELNWINVETYAKGVHLVDLTHCRIRGGHVYGKSPNSQYAPGYNGLLSEVDTATTNLIIENFTVEDAGEHGYRISGPQAHDRVVLDKCTAIKSGGSGFKVLDDIGDGTIKNRSVTLKDCEAIDSGMLNQNCCGFLIQMVDGMNLINPSVRKKDQQYSAVEGIRISGVNAMIVSNPKIRNAFKFGIHIDEAFGNIRDLKITGIHIDMTTGFGIYLQNPGISICNVELEGFVNNTATDGGCFYAGKYTAATETGTWDGSNKLDLTFSLSSPSASQVSSSSSPVALGSFFANIRGRRTWTVPFRPGSLWHDDKTNTRQILQNTTNTWETILPRAV